MPPLPPFRPDESRGMPLSIRMRLVFRRRQASGQTASKKFTDQRPRHRRKKVGGVPAETSALCPYRRKYPRRRNLRADCENVVGIDLDPSPKNYLYQAGVLHQRLAPDIQEQTDCKDYAT